MVQKYFHLKFRQLLRINIPKVFDVVTVAVEVPYLMAHDRLCGALLSLYRWWVWLPLWFLTNRLYSVYRFSKVRFPVEIMVMFLYFNGFSENYREVIREFRRYLCVFEPDINKF